MRSAWIALLWLAVLCKPLGAQSVSGRVTGPHGPLADAVVILHDSTGEYGRALTSATGRFAFELEPSVVPIFLLVRAIGFVPLSFRLPSPISAPVSIALVPFAQPLPDLAIHATKARCPTNPTAQAGRLWEAARTRYTVPRPDQGLEFLGRLVKETVDPKRIGEIDEERLQPGLKGQNGSMRAPASASIDDAEYGRRLDGDLDLLLSVAKGNDLYALWWYPALDSWQVDHWVQPAFGNNHELSAIALPDGTFDLIFCPRSTKRPSISGVLTLSADTTLQSAIWAFQTGKPHEYAGGRVDFRPLTASTATFLEPTLGVFWRKLAGGQRFVQRVMAFSRMTVGADRAIPGRTR
jgi:hypothetical protein